MRLLLPWGVLGWFPNEFEEPEKQVHELGGGLGGSWVASQLNTNKRYGFNHGVLGGAMDFVPPQYVFLGPPVERLE